MAPLVSGRKEKFKAELGPKLVHTALCLVAPHRNMTVTNCANLG